MCAISTVQSFFLLFLEVSQGISLYVSPVGLFFNLSNLPANSQSYPNHWSSASTNLLPHLSLCSLYSMVSIGNLGSDEHLENSPSLRRVSSGARPQPNHEPWLWPRQRSRSRTLLRDSLFSLALFFFFKSKSYTASVAWSMQQ